MHMLGIDIGTSGCKALVFDEAWNILAFSHREYDLVSTGDDRFDLEAETVWQKTREAIQESREKTGEQIDAVAVSALGDVIIPLDREGRTVRPSIIDFDPRGKEEIAAFVGELGAERIFGITGMPPLHINSLAKILWLKKNEPGTFRKVHRWATFEDYILQKLGVKPTVSYSMAARTMLFDVGRRSWSQEILDAVGLSESSLPETVPSGTVIAGLEGEGTENLGFSSDAAACSGGHDMVCAAIGAGLDECDPRTALNIVGTMEGVIVLMKELNTSRKMLQKLYPCYPGYREYVSLSLNLTSGSIVKWYRDLLSSSCIREREAAGYEELLRGIDDSMPGSLLFIPHFSGTCNPVFDPDARGVVYGLSLDTNMRDLTQGIIEGLCYELKVHLQGFEEAGISIDRLKTVGGGAQSSTWLQLKANITGLEIVNTDIPEASAMGAAALCAAAIGVVDNPYDVSRRRGTRETRYIPSREAAAIFEERFLRYQALSRNINRFEAN